MRASKREREGRYFAVVPPLHGDLSRVVGELLRERVDARGVTQTEIAAASGMSQSTLSRSLSGLRRWDLDQLAAVCRYLGTKASDVIAVAEEEIGDS